jgi:hypothetical protein
MSSPCALLERQSGRRHTVEKNASFGRSQEALVDKERSRARRMEDLYTPRHKHRRGYQTRDESSATIGLLQLCAQSPHVQLVDAYMLESVKPHKHT